MIGVSGGGGDALELHEEHSEVEDLDEGEFSLVLSRLNLISVATSGVSMGLWSLVTLFCAKCVRYNSRCYLLSPVQLLMCILLANSMSASNSGGPI